MQVLVRVFPQAKKNAVRQEAGILKIYITAPAVEGKANKALVPVLAEHFGVRKSQVRIVRGLTSRNKIIEVIE